MGADHASFSLISEAAHGTLNAGRGIAKGPFMIRVRWFALACVLLSMRVVAGDDGPPADAAAAIGDPAEGRVVRVAGIVLKWIRGEKETNFQRAEPMIREAAANGAELVVTTECFLDGYAIADKSIPLDVYRALGEPIPDGPYFQRLAALAKELKIHLIAGMIEADGEHRFNTAVLIGSDGALLGKYRKQKLGHELARNTPGDKSLVFPTRFGKLGLLICADRTDADIVRRYRENGAEFLICPSGGMFGPKTNDPIVQARSKENRLPIVFVHPAEFLVTYGDGSIRANELFGDKLLVDRETIGGAEDRNRICYFELPVGGGEASAKRR
jgi:predicted amidohydrolase